MFVHLVVRRAATQYSRSGWSRSGRCCCESRASREASKPPGDGVARRGTHPSRPPQTSARCRQQDWGSYHAHSAAVHRSRPLPLRDNRIPHGVQRDSQSGRLGGVPPGRRGSARGVVAGGVRRAGAEVLPPRGRAGPPHPRSREGRAGLAVAAGGRRGGDRRASRGRAQPRRAQRQAGVRPARRHLDLLGLEGRLLRLRGGRARLLRRAALHAGDAEGGAELAAVVQHRAALGLRHRRPGAGPLLRRPRDRPGAGVALRLRAAAAARLLHPEHRRRSGQRGRHHGPVGPRGAPVQVRLRLGDQLLAPARRERAAVRRRQVVRADELPEDRRPRRRRHQVRRHDAARGEDGGRRHRPSGHRAVHRLEGARGTEGRGAGRRLPPGEAPPRRGAAGVPRGRGRRRRPSRSEAQPGAAAGDPRGAQGDDPGERHPAGDRARPPRARRGRFPGVRHRLGFGGLPHRLRPERQQQRARHQRLPGEGAAGRRLGADPPHRRRRGQAGAARARCGRRSRRPPGAAPTRPAVRQHHQRVAHLPGERPHQRLQPVLGVHVPRRHRLQSRLAQPARLPERRRHARRGGVRARRPAVDDRPRDLGDDGAVPVAPDRPAVVRVPHAGPRLRQHRRLPDGGRHPLRFRRGAPPVRRRRRADDRRRLHRLGGAGGRARRLPPLCREPGGDAAGDPQPPPRRARRGRGLRGAVGAAGAAERSTRPRRGAGGRRAQSLGPGAGAGRGARLPQRADDGDRADRHHRPGDGLRHHRHRAGLRAGQVQEAGGRRLLQDHQPDGAAGARPPRLRRRRDREDHRVRRRPRHAARFARHRASRAARQGLRRRGDRRRRAGAGRRLRHPLRLQQVDARRALLRRTARHRRPSASTTSASACSPRSASPRTRSRRRTSTSAAR